MGTGCEVGMMESIKLEGGHLLDQVRRVLHEGNVRRMRIRQGDRVVAEFPLTAGVVGVALAPVLAAVGAAAALLDLDLAGLLKLQLLLRALRALDREGIQDMQSEGGPADPRGGS